MKRNVATFVREDGRGNERAFTLVELMAVIVALCVLAALVVPALAYSDDNGTRMVCLNNLRQMGMAATQYAEDNLDYLAFCNWGAAGPGWLYNTNSMTSSGIPDPTLAPWKSNPITAWQTGLWFQYVQNQKYYLCPVDLESKYYGQRPNKLSSYSMDGAACGFARTGTYITCKTTDAWSTACWLLWEPNDYVNGANTFFDGANTPMPADIEGCDGPGGIHTVNASQVLSVGGNVEILGMAYIQEDENRVIRFGPGPNGKTYGWWSPFSYNGY